MQKKTKVNTNLLKIDCKAETERIRSWIRDTMIKRLKRRGLVVSVSGGIDSAVTAALCVKSLGPEKVFALLLPENESNSETTDLSKALVEGLSINFDYIDISPILSILGCYNKRDNAIRRVIPQYGEGWKSKIVLNSALENEPLHYFSVVAVSPDGKEVKTRLDKDAYLEIVAATNFKQRVRKMLEYHHADRLNYAVAGTPNRLEYDQGFFVKLGDGAADIKPIAHLYKSQVYQMAEYLDVPEAIRTRPPTTDTYSLSQSQEEFFFSLPYDQMDLCLYGKSNNVSAEEIAKLVGLEKSDVEKVYKDIEQKRRSAGYLHVNSLLIEKG